MFQTFTATTTPDQGPDRLLALRAVMARDGLAGFMVPRADAHQGEYVAPRDDRLAWLTGFTGSAGFCIVLPDMAGVFVDGRYRLQVVDQVAGCFTPVPWPDVQPGPWIRQHLPEGVVGYDPWLHSPDEIAKIEAALNGHPVSLRPCRNLIDQIWPDQPGPPQGRAWPHSVELAGEDASAKRARLAEGLRAVGQRAAVITLPDSICWLLNLRGSDVPRNPLLHGFAILHDDGRVTLFADAAKFDDVAQAALQGHATLRPVAGFEPALQTLQGPVRLDRASVPMAVVQALDEAQVAHVWGDDPCRVPKARKNRAELDGMRAAHRRDGVAMARFLHWAEHSAQGKTEIDVVRVLEKFRSDTNALHDISFDTICGAGPNGAIMHYRVTEETNRVVAPDSVLLVDSGAQYHDGTTDITRTLGVGAPPEDARLAFTAVLQGMIALSRARWPKGLAGRDLDAIARYPLWQMGRDYDHGTGHGVGAFLSVHEGPQRISKVSDVPLEPGMILSNEPGYYKPGSYGIRIENLVVVVPAPAIEGQDAREMLAFETLTLAPFDRRMIVQSRLSRDDLVWLDAYHARVLAEIGPGLAGADLEWLREACAPMGARG